VALEVTGAGGKIKRRWVGRPSERLNVGSCGLAEGVWTQGVFSQRAFRSS
jgi:hypothetical protein